MDEYILYGFVGLIVFAFVGTLITLAVDGDLLRLWNGVKEIFIEIATFGYRLSWADSKPALPEPDWAAAADEVGFFDPIDHLLLNVSAWTPEEREAYGVNATDRLIDAIDDELKGWEWQQISSRRTTAIPLPSRSETASEKAIRRNGQQIVAGVIDAEKVWAGPAPAINTQSIFR